MSDSEYVKLYGAVKWLYSQSFIPTACPCGRLNLIGGLILWELARRSQSIRDVPRLALYGVSDQKLRIAANNIAKLMTLPLCEDERRDNPKSHGHKKADEILLIKTPKSPPQNTVNEDYRFFLFAGQVDPHLWIVNQAQARRTLPIRIYDTEIQSGELIFEPNPVVFLCDEWIKAGRPEAVTHPWTWPDETRQWRSTVENVLKFAKWSEQPHTVFTVDDF